MLKDDPLAFYDTMVQIIPVLILAMAVELRLDVLGGRRDGMNERIRNIAPWLYVFTLWGLGMSEVVCILTIARRTVGNLSYGLVLYPTVVSSMMLAAVGAAAVFGRKKSDDL